MIDGDIETTCGIRGTVHRDQSSQHASGDYLDFLNTHNLIPSVSHRGHCLDNVVAENFFHSFETERIKRKVYVNRSEVRAILFDYIEVFYNRTRLDSHLRYVPQMKIHIYTHVKCLRYCGKVTQVFVLTLRAFHK